MTEGLYPPASVGAPVSPPEPLRHGLGNAATGGVWRVRGANAGAVLKIARPPHPERAHMAWPTSDDPAHWNYWRRESLSYESGLAASAYCDAGIAVPQVLDVIERADGGVELWLEDVPGDAGFDWEVPRLARFAYELGVGQARWIGRVPDHAWLSRGWLAQYSCEGPGRSVQLPEGAWDSAQAAAVWPSSVRAGLARLWAERARVLAMAESFERTLCHLDVWPSNLIDASGTSMLLDWSFVGEGAVGEDVANLIVDSCSDGLMDMALLPQIAHSCAESYISGLRDGGWSGSEDQVRSAIFACGAAKYSWLGPAFLGRALREETGRGSYGQDDSAAAAVRRVTDLVTLVAEWADSALGVSS
jgi:Phosphotransferase enzyme family